MHQSDVPGVITLQIDVPDSVRDDVREDLLECEDLDAVEAVLNRLDYEFETPEWHDQAAD